MGACTSTTKHREKYHTQSHKRLAIENPIVVDNRQFSSIPLTVNPNQKYQRSDPFLSNIDCQVSSVTEPIFHPINNNSLIQLYSPNTNNNNSNINSLMSSSSSSTPQSSTRIPISKVRLSVHQPPSSPPVVEQSKPKLTASSNMVNKKDSNRPMSTPIRSPLTPSSQNNPHSRMGFIPRPIVPSLQSTQASSIAERSRSISPSSTMSANSSSTTTSQRLIKTATIPKPTTSRSVTTSSNNTHAAKLTKSVPVTHNHNKDSSVPKPSSSTTTRTNTTTTTTTATHRLHSNTSSQIPAATSSPPVPPPKTNVNAIRDRYKTQNRMNTHGRRTSTSNSLKSTSTIKEEKNEQSSNDDQTLIITLDKQNDDSKTEASQQGLSSHGDSAYASITTPLNHLPSTNQSQADRRRASSTLSSSSHVSDVLNNDAFLDDDNCSLKSDDLICDYDDTLTLESVSKNDRTDSLSSLSLSVETNKKPTMITSSTTITKPNIPLFQSISRENRSHTIAKCSPSDKINASLLESLDELTQLSSRLDNVLDSEHSRKLMARSVSLKPPIAALPPRDDGELITMDVESYRQVMKDVMVVKTILHQLDRLLKHSDGTNMTDSMIGSFHESMISSRHYSVSGGDSIIRNPIDENASYDDLFKEIMILRKEREQDRQTIKLLQEQMYKYSSQTNGL